MKKPEIKQPTVKKGEFKAPSFAKDKFEIPEDVAKELAEKGLKGRWISMKELELGSGYHRKGWVPYKKETPSEIEKLFGKSPDGFVRHGDLVLGVKKEEDVQAHRAWLRQEAKNNSVKEITKRTKKNFQDSIRQAGAQDAIKVVEGYDED
jgi:hypothetical protein